MEIVKRLSVLQDMNELVQDARQRVYVAEKHLNDCLGCYANGNQLIRVAQHKISNALISMVAQEKRLNGDS
jgi:hypothetical protein